MSLLKKLAIKINLAFFKRSVSTQLLAILIKIYIFSGSWMVLCGPDRPGWGECVLMVGDLFNELFNAFDFAMFR